MASGYGIYGGPSRCFPFWQEMLACYIVNTTSDDTTGARKCLPHLDDYEECLHHKKEKERVRAIQAAYRKSEASFPREDTPSIGEVRGLGLLGKEEQSRALLAKIAKSDSPS